MALFQKATPSPTEPTGRRRRDTSHSTRPQAFSYYAKRAAPDKNTGRGDGDDMRINHAVVYNGSWRRKMSVLALGVTGALLIGLLCTLNTSPKMITQNTTGSAYFMQDVSVYEQAARHTLSGSLLNRSKITVDTAKVSNTLIKNYPELKSVDVNVPLIGFSPTVVLQPHTPSLILTTPSNAAFLLDENGRALVSVSQIDDAGELSVPTVRDKANLRLAQGVQALSSNTVRFITEVLHVFDSTKVDYGTLTLPEATNEFDVAIAGSPYYVKFNLQGDPKLQAGTFLATKARLQKDKITPTQYIDVRVPDRAYYK